MKIDNKYLTFVLVILASITIGLVLKKYNNNHVQYTYSTSPISTKEILSFKGKEYNMSKKYITIFFDYTCPYCELFDSNIQSISEDSDVSLIYFHRPLDSVSFNAALAVECAKEQNSFTTIHSFLIQNNNILQSIDLKNIGKEIGVNNPAKFKKCYTSKKFEPDIEKDVRLADSLMINAVPAFIINNQLFEGIMSKSQLKKELQKKG